MQAELCSPRCKSCKSPYVSRVVKELFFLKMEERKNAVGMRGGEGGGDGGGWGVYMES